MGQTPPRLSGFGADDHKVNYAITILCSPCDASLTFT